MGIQFTFIKTNDIHNNTWFILHLMYTSKSIFDTTRRILRWCGVKRTKTKRNVSRCIMSYMTVFHIVELDVNLQGCFQS